MAARKALVKRLEKVEALGATTVILTDKTGTLTENEMTVRQAWTEGRYYQFSGVAYDHGAVEARQGEPQPAALIELLRTAALCCDARLKPLDEHGRWSAIGDPTEAAVLVAAAKAGLAAQVLEAWPRLGELPFDSARLASRALPATCCRCARRRGATECRWKHSRGRSWS
jgi:magnesium-transporting ATPase (P-type)